MSWRPSRSTRYAVIHQADGGRRLLYAATTREAAEARELIRQDPALIDTIGPHAIVYEDRDGRRRRVPDFAMCDRCGVSTADEYCPDIYAVWDEVSEDEVHTSLCAACYAKRVGRFSRMGRAPRDPDV